MRHLLFILLVLAAFTGHADSALTTATENKALYATTIATTADIGGNATVGGTLGVTNNATFGGTVGITGNTTIGGTLGITGNTTIGGLLLQPTHALTTSTTLTAAHQFVTVNDTAGDVVLTLADPTVLTNVNVTLMKRTGTNRTTFTSTALINGIANTMPLPILEAVTLRSNGATWNILSAAENTIFNLFTAATTTLTVGDIRNAYYDNAASITVNLPSATNFSTLGRIYYHKKTGGLNTTTLDPAGSETIDGAATLTLSTLGGVAIYSDLSNWYVVSSSGLGAGSGDALVANPLSQFAATTSAQLAGVISDETGSGALVFGTAPQISTIELGHASDTTLARASAGVLAVEGVNVLTTAAGTAVSATVLATARTINGVSFDGSANIVLPEYIYVDAGAMAPFATAGATAATTTLATTGFPSDEYAFDASTDEKVAFKMAMGTNWNGTTLSAKFVWRSTATTGNCVWTISARFARDGDQVDTTFGTAISLTDGTAGTANYQNISADSGTITPSGTYSAGCMVYFIITRDADNGSDTLAVDALLDAVQVKTQ